MNEPFDLTAILTEEERKKIAARVFREECQKVIGNLVRNAVLDEARRTLPDVVPDAVRAEIKKMLEVRYGFPSPIASALTAEFRKCIIEFLSTVTLRFEPSSPPGGAR